MVDTVGVDGSFNEHFPGNGADASDVDVIRFLLLDGRNPADFMDQIQVHPGVLHNVIADGYFRS